MNTIDNVMSPRSVAGAGFVRSDNGRSRNSDEKFASLFQEFQDDGERGQGAAEGSVSERHDAGKLIEGEAQLLSETVARPAPDDPGFVMVQKLAGDDKTDEALGRLLDDLDDIKSARLVNEGSLESVQPVAPFANSNSAGGQFRYAASAYEWGAQALNSKDSLRPGVIYSEQF